MLLPSKVAVISEPPVILNVALSPSSTSLLDKLKAVSYTHLKLPTILLV